MKPVANRLTHKHKHTYNKQHTSQMPVTSRQIDYQKDRQTERQKTERIIHSDMKLDS